DCALASSGDSDAAVPGRIAISIAGRARCSALGHGPRRREALPRGLRQQQRVGLRRGAYAEARYVRQVEQRTPGDLGIDDGASQEIGGRAGQCQQRRAIRPPVEDSATAIVSPRCLRRRAALSARAIKSCMGALLLLVARTCELARTVAPRL